MKLSLLPFAACILCAVASGETPGPALAQLQENFAAEIKALNDKRNAAIKLPRERYITALNDAEVAARAASRNAEIAAIETERKAFEAMKFAPTVPGLPGRLAQTRAIFLAALVNAARQFQPAIDAANGRHLRDLTALETTAKQAGNQPLLAQVAAAKAKHAGIPEAAPAPVSPPKPAAMPPPVIAETKPAVKPPPPPDTETILPNGDFTFQEPGDATHAAVWRYRNGECVSLIHEFGNAFLRMDSTSTSPSGFNQKARIPEGIGALKITLRARVSKVELHTEDGKVKGRPAFFGWAQNDAGENLKGFIIHLERPSRGWDTFEATLTVPEGARWLNCTGEMMKTKGIVDIDDIRIVPMR